MTIEYHKPSHLTTSYVICLTKHMTEVAYERYYRRHPYIEELIEMMILPQDEGDTWIILELSELRSI